MVHFRLRLEGTGEAGGPGSLDGPTGAGGLSIVRAE